MKRIISRSSGLIVLALLLSASFSFGDPRPVFYDPTTKSLFIQPGGVTNTIATNGITGLTDVYLLTNGTRAMAGDLTFVLYDGTGNTILPRPAILDPGFLRIISSNELVFAVTNVVQLPTGTDVGGEGWRLYVTPAGDSYIVPAHPAGNLGGEFFFAVPGYTNVKSMSITRSGATPYVWIRNLTATGGLAVQGGNISFGGNKGTNAAAGTATNDVIILQQLTDATNNIPGGATYTGGLVVANFGVSNSNPRLTLTNTTTSAAFYIEHPGDRADFYVSKYIPVGQIASWANPYQAQMVGRYDFTSTNTGTGFLSSDDTYPSSAWDMTNVSSVARVVVGTNAFGRVTHAAQFNGANHLRHRNINALTQTVGYIAWWMYPTDAGTYQTPWGCDEEIDDTHNSYFTPFYHGDTKKVDVYYYLNGVNLWRADVGVGLVPQNAWTHIIVAKTNNAAQPDFYHNGTNAGTWTITTDKTKWFAALVTATKPVTNFIIGATVGATAYGAHFHGNISSFKIGTNGTFSATDAWNLYANTIPTNNVEFYKEDPGSSSTFTVKAMSVDSNGYVRFISTPTSPPSASGYVWNSNGFLMITP